MPSDGYGQDRRSVLAGLGLAPLMPMQAEAAPGLTVYSPAPASHPMHALNLALGAAVAASGGPVVHTVPVALPDSINRIADLPADVRPWHLPIVTTVDFALARAGGGPDWHRYDRAHPDLLFVSALYEVGFGLFTTDAAIVAPGDLRGRRIAVPPRPSSLRLLTEALLGDGWGMLDDVVLVDMPPHSAFDGLAAGTVDATTWNLVLPGASGPRPVSGVAGRFLGVDRAAFEGMGRNGLRPGAMTSEESGPTLVSFAQALAAWADTPSPIVAALADALRASSGMKPGSPTRAGDIARWPELADDQIHPAALFALGRT